MIHGNCITKVAAFFVLASSVWAAESVMVVDRGLPQANLNNVSGTARSNVRWASDGESFMGDDFAIGSPGEKWVIDSIRTWAVPGMKSDPEHLGDFYQDVRLYFGPSNGSLTPRVSAALEAGSDQTSSASVRISEATKAGAVPYDDFGAAMRIWQIDFTNLNIVVDGGVKYGFGVWGLGRPVPGNADKGFEWFNHASNADLSGAKQDGADGQMLMFDGSGKAQGSFKAQGNGWDKNSDINIQVFAHRVGGSQTTQAAAQ